MWLPLPTEESCHTHPLGSPSLYTVGTISLDVAPLRIRYLGVMAVVGITSHQHPLLAHRGFYTLDGVHRLVFLA